MTDTQIYQTIQIHN